MAEELKKEEPKKNNNSESPHYSINCTAKPIKPQTFYPLQTEKNLLQNTESGKVFGYEFDVYEKNKGFKVINYSLRGISNHFISALHACFMNHLPLQLRPDDIWIIIAQGIAIHITENAEKLKKKLVDFDDKKTITVRDDTLNINSDKNDWTYVLNQFSGGCRKLTNNNIVDLITNDFKTSTLTSKIASQCVLFKALSKYISFKTMTRSGIPEIILVGSINDWKKIEDKCNKIKAMDLDLNWWLDELIPIIKNIILSLELITSKKKLTKDLVTFWDSIYHYMSMSGGARITGWCKTLFPYIGGHGYFSKNPELKRSSKDFYWPATSPGDFPATYSKCPMKWDYFGKIIDCQMCGGIFGLSQNKNNGAIAPVIGWIVCETM